MKLGKTKQEFQPVTSQLKATVSKNKLLLFGVLVSGLALAAPSSYKLIIAGKTSNLTATTVNGKPYIPLEALKSLGVSYNLQGNTITLGSGVAAAGGNDQRASLEGCINEQLFNGVWRIRVLKLERISKETDWPGWGLTVELRNGSKTTIAGTDAGMNPNGQGYQLAFSDASTLDADGMEVQPFNLKNLPPGGVLTHQLKFFYPFGTKEDAVKTPVKFLLEVNPKGIGFTPSQNGVAFSVPNPSFRVRLDCSR